MLSCRCRFFSLSLLCSSVHQREKGGGFLRGPLSSGTKAAAHSHLLLQLLGADVWCPHSTLCLALSSHQQYTHTPDNTHTPTTHTHTHPQTNTPPHHTHTPTHTQTETEENQHKDSYLFFFPQYENRGNQQ